MLVKPEYGNSVVCFIGPYAFEDAAAVYWQPITGEMNEYV